VGSGSKNYPASTFVYTPFTQGVFINYQHKVCQAGLAYSKGSKVAQTCQKGVFYGID